MKILILQVATPNIKDYSIYSIPININYSIKWDYDFLLYTHKEDAIDYHPAWLKITSFYNINIEKYDWIWILDADAVINNDKIKLEDIISNCNKPIIISKNGKNGGRYLNSGSILIKSDFVKELLLKYEDCVRKGYVFLNENFWDQELINDWYEESPEHFSVRKMKELNSHWMIYAPSKEYCLQNGINYVAPYNQKKNLIHHFMSLPIDTRINWMRNNWICNQIKVLKKMNIFVA